MAVTYNLPKPNADKGFFIDTPLAGDSVLAQGELTLLNEAGDDAIVVKINDITGWQYDAFAAGTAHVVDVDVTAAVLVADSTYTLTVAAPYVLQNGVKESEAVYTARTYTVSVDATPTVAELQTLFVDAINNDLNAYFSATAEAGDIVRITADSAEAGQMVVTTSVDGATVADQTAWVEPVGTLTEVQAETASIAQAGTQYNRYIIEFDERIRHNAVKGLSALKNTKAVYYLDVADAGTAAAVTLITSILDGSYATVADFLGAPNI